MTDMGSSMYTTLGKFDGKNIIVGEESEASQLYGKGYFGLPQKGGSLKLDIIEAIYLVEVGNFRPRYPRLSFLRDHARFCSDPSRKLDREEVHVICKVYT